MKKYILIIILIFVVGCSLDTFKSDNLASWSINFDFPLFKTTYTIAKLLDDYDELGVEQYENTSDSIYVFNANTPHEVDVRRYTIKKDGDDVLPEIVDIPNYELEIPTLPEELDGINFVDIDLFIEVDLSQFRTDLADSVLINNILLSGTNSYGITKTASITNQMIWKNQQIINDGVLIIENPEDLINNRPYNVEISGFITVYPTDNEGEQIGEIINLTSILHAPLILEITETSTFSGSPSLLKVDIGEDLIEGLSLFIDIDNQLEIGGDLQVLVSPDTMNFEKNSLITPDTLLTLELLPKFHKTETIELDSTKIDLLADSTYMKTFLNFVSISDGQGNTLPTRFFTDDSIKVLIYSSAQLLIDPQNTGGE